MRKSKIERKTAETEICLSLNLDGSGEREIEINCGFLKHMMELFAAHSRFDLKVFASGDVEVDYHHLTEDLGIVLGQALKEALGDKGGIRRYGDMLLPMDEALILAAVDVSGRSCLGYQVDLPKQKVGDFDTELVREFFLGFVRSSGVTLHFQELAGENTHHIIEGMFKAFGRALRKATEVDRELNGEIPSTKGIL